MSNDIGDKNDKLSKSELDSIEENTSKILF